MRVVFFFFLLGFCLFGFFFSIFFLVLLVFVKIICKISSLTKIQKNNHLCYSQEIRTYLKW